MAKVGPTGGPSQDGKPIELPEIGKLGSHKAQPTEGPTRGEMLKTGLYAGGKMNHKISESIPSSAQEVVSRIEKIMGHA